MTEEKLKEILALHDKWVFNKKEGKRANLSYDDLRNFHLNSAYLGEANLRHTDLRGVDLRNANLINADLTCANLEGADLRGANLQGAILNYTNFCCANLDGANLDSSCIPLGHGGLLMGIDNRQTLQILYHLVKNALYSSNVDNEIKVILSKKEIIDLANQSHCTKENGEIKLQISCKLL